MRGMVSGQGSTVSARIVVYEDIPLKNDFLLCLISNLTLTADIGKTEKANPMRLTFIML